MISKSRSIQFLATFLMVGVSPKFAFGQVPLGTEFTYQGKLSFAGEPLNDSADFEFRLFNDEVAGVEVGTVNVIHDALVVDGVFTVGLDFDNVFGDTALYLEVAVRSPHDPTNTMAYTVLNPRQPITPAPVALALRHLRTESNVNGPNVIGGASSNLVTAGSFSATIGGGADNRVEGERVAIGGGSNNTATGFAATIGGGADNNVFSSTGTIAGGAFNNLNGSSAAIGGGFGNLVDGAFGTIAGGGPLDPFNEFGTNNRVYDDYGTIGGGTDNRVGSDDADSTTDRFGTIAGGSQNRATANSATIGGGFNNQATGNSSAIFGGGSHIASGQATFIGGGTLNEATADFAIIGGGKENQVFATFGAICGGGAYDDGISTFPGNRIYDNYGFIGGGSNNIAGIDDADPLNGFFASVAGGFQNTASGSLSSVSGGDKNTASGSWSVVSGGVLNVAAGSHSVVAGGLDNQAQGESSFIGGGGQNRATGSSATIGGGFNNQANGNNSAIFAGGSNVASGQVTFIGGGTANEASADFATISGGQDNQVLATHGVIAGGGSRGQEVPGNRVFDDYGVIGGGSDNIAGSDGAIAGFGEYATIGGGRSNIVYDFLGTIGGGRLNQVGVPALESAACCATVGGGSGNIARRVASTVAGGFANQALANYATIPGGHLNLAGGEYSFAAGLMAKVRQGDPTEAYYSGDLSGDEGTFVWADSTFADFVSTGPDQFLIRASGGVGIGTNEPARPLHVSADQGIARIESANNTGGGSVLELSNKTVATDLSLGAINFLDSAGAVPGQIAYIKGNFVGDDILTFRVDASERMRVTGLGTVGIGTANPTSSLHVANERATMDMETTNSNAGSLLILRNNTSATDVTLGTLAFVGTSGQLSGEIRYQDNELIDYMKFDVGGSERIRVTSAGTLEIGTQTGSTALGLRVDAGSDVGLSNGGFLQLGDAGSANMAFDQNEIMARNNGSGATLFINPSQGDLLIGNNNANVRVGIGLNTPAQALDVDGNVQASCGILLCSDARFKKNVSPLDSALNIVNRLCGVNFEWRNEEFPERQWSNGNQIGFIAQEVEAVVPEIVSKGTEGYYSVDYGRLTPVLVEAIKEQQRQLNNQSRTIERYEQELADTNHRIERLELLIKDMLAKQEVEE